MSVVIITVGDEKLLKTRWSEGKGNYTIVPVNPDFFWHKYHLEDYASSSSDQHSTFKKVALATGLGLSAIVLGDTVSDKKIWKRIKNWFKKRKE